jgi:hypothetical protein
LRVSEESRPRTRVGLSKAIAGKNTTMTGVDGWSDAMRERRSKTNEMSSAEKPKRGEAKMRHVCPIVLDAGRWT